MVALPKSALSVLICDDHTIICEALAHALQADGEFSVTSTHDKESGLALMRARRFDIVLMDIQMPGMNGTAGLSDAIAAAPDSRVVVFSGTVNRDFVDCALQRGAAGFIPKTMPLNALAGVVRLIAAGQVFIPVEYQRRLSGVEGANLTPREREVLGHLAQGKMNKQIAAEMNLSEMTVKMHVRGVCNKLGARNRTQAAMLAEKRTRT